jgi:hypothetical protein
MNSRICLPANVTGGPSAGACAMLGAPKTEAAKTEAAKTEAPKRNDVANRHCRDFVILVNLCPCPDASRGEIAGCGNRSKAALPGTRHT